MLMASCSIDMFSRQFLFQKLASELNRRILYAIVMRLRDQSLGESLSQLSTSVVDAGIVLSFRIAP